MCEECGVSSSFCLISFLYFGGIFVASLLNMVNSINGNKYDITFKEAKLVNYKNRYKTKFLFGFDFGKELSMKNDYNSSLKIEETCYIGTCISESESKQIKNCSKACFEQIKDCFNGEEKCYQNQCRETYWKYEESECREFNRIERWRDTEMFKDSEIIKYIPYTQIKAKNETCDKGYRRCGKVNEEEDFFCFKEDYPDFECPINKILILPNNDTPSDNFNYKKYKIGDKNIFFTNENIDDYLITDLFINFDTDKYDSKSYLQLIDEDSYLNFSKYNNLYLNKIPSRAKLNIVQYHTNFTVKEMKSEQEIFEKKTELYSPEKIEEMNSNVKNNKNLLVGLGIGAFSSFATTVFFFLIFYSTICQCGKFGCECLYGDDITPMKLVITFILVFFPCTFLSLISLIITCSKKNIYNNYLSMNYINDYKNYEEDRYKGKIDIFENSIIYNNNQFLSLLYIIITTIIYPILIKIKSRKENSLIIGSNSSTKGKRNYQNKNPKITSGYNSNKLYSKPGHGPLISDNYDTRKSINDNEFYQGETPYYQ